MCGIAGAYRLGPAAPTEEERAEDRALVAAMLRRLAHRGPDDEGIRAGGRATLGARRLSILDVAGGHQPLSDARGHAWAVQNGEIYNFPALRADLSTRHAFRTGTDTELLPHLWLEHGTRTPALLSGMFAIAIHDTRDDTLLLARDAAGVKPLYVARTGDRLLFASEMRALLVAPGIGRDLDEDAIAAYLALGFVPGEATPFRSIRKVRPGHRLVVTAQGVRTERWREWPVFRTEPGPADLDALAAEAGRRLAASVESMLLSDRPVGLLLSGGLDSSLLTAVLPRGIRGELRTYAIGFENGGLHDERAFAGRVATHLGTRHRDLTVPLDPTREFRAVVRMLDEPCADPAAVPAHLVARAAASEVTVLLSGTGGDEVFGGYRRYALPSLLRRLRWLPRSWSATAARTLADGARHRGSAAGFRTEMLRKLLEARGRDDFGRAYLSTLEPAAPWRWREALARPLDPAAAGLARWTAVASELPEPLTTEVSSAFAFDHLYYLPDDLLLKEDRTTMGASVEGRVPFLDPAVVAFGATLPASAREAGAGKRVLRRLAASLLPAEIAARPKHGFSVPIEDWLRGPLREFARDTLRSNRTGTFRPDVLGRWLDEHDRGRDRSRALWAALCLETWWDEVGGVCGDAS